MVTARLLSNHHLSLSITCRAPTLFRRFGSAGEVAVDLLARLLAFDSARRCGCEEALAHEYFEDLVRVLNSEIGQMDPVVQRTVSDAAAAVSGMDQHMDDQEGVREVLEFESWALDVVLKRLKCFNF